MKKINRNKISGFQNISFWNFGCYYYSKWWSSATYKNFPCLTGTGKKMSETLIPSFFMVLSSKRQSIFGFAWHMLILFFNYVQQSSLPLLNSNGITNTKLSNQHWYITGQAS